MGREGPNICTTYWERLRAIGYKNGLEQQPGVLGHAGDVLAATAASGQ